MSRPCMSGKATRTVSISPARTSVSSPSKLKFPGTSSPSVGAVPASYQADGPDATESDGGRPAAVAALSLLVRLRGHPEVGLQRLVALGELLLELLRIGER